jgi:hypothetical protein
MKTTRRIADGFLAVLICATFLGAIPALAAGEAKAGSKLALTPESAPQLLETVRPHDSEWRHLGVEWLTDVVAARKRAAVEDKPILICYTGGAGYNEPLGIC